MDPEGLCVAIEADTNNCETTEASSRFDLGIGGY